MILRNKKQYKEIRQITPPRKRSNLTPLTPRIELTPIQDNVYTINEDSVPVSDQNMKRNLFENTLSYEITENLEIIEHNKIWSPISEPYEDSGSEYVPSDVDKELTPIRDNEYRPNVNPVKVCHRNVKRILFGKNFSDKSTDQAENNTASKETSSSSSNLPIIKTESIENMDCVNLLRDDDIAISTSSASDCDIEAKLKCSRKRHFCPFCKTLQLAFGRHVLNRHKNESCVQDILTLPKNSFERKKKLSNLRGKGMHLFNSTCGQRLVVRQPKINDPSVFLPCPNCEGYFLPRNIARHQKRCTNRPPNRAGVLHMAKQLRKSVQGIDNILADRLLSRLKNDNITEVIKTDKTLLLLTESISMKYAKDNHLSNFMSQKLRQLARLLLKIKEIDKEISDFESCFAPEKYNVVKKAIYLLCELNVNNFTYKKPSLAAHLGAMLKDCVNVFQIQNIKMGLRESRSQIKLNDFLLIHEKEYGSLIAKNAISSLEQNKWNKPQIMPSLEDIQIFQDYLKLRAETSFSNLRNKGFIYSDWLSLNKSCLLILLTFNRRRVGEMSRILVENYKNRQGITKDLYKTMTRLECILANEFQRIEIRGKRGRRVPVLVTVRHIEYIDMLLNYRTQAAVSDTNPYLFAVSHKKGFLDAGVIIRDYSLKCGASDAKTLRGTYLRKQVATISQLLNLNDNEIQQLADFMGHDVAIHRLHYRKPEISLQVTRLSKFFMAAGELDIEKYKDKSLEELDVYAASEADETEEEKNDKRNDSFSDEETDKEEKSKSSNISATSFSKFQHEITPTKTSPRIEINPTKATSSRIEITPTKTSLPKHPQCKKISPRNIKHTTPSKKSSLTKLKYYFNTPFSYVISPCRRNVQRRIKWTPAEKQLINNEFKIYLSSKTLPSFAECVAFRDKYISLMKARTVPQIKAFINNLNKKTK